MISVSILPKSFDDLKGKLELTNFCSSVQIDVVDGKFADNTTWPYSANANVYEAEEVILNREVEVDLMVLEPLNAAEHWLAIGAKRLVFHIESNFEIDEVLSLKNVYQFELGFSLNNETPLENLYPYLQNTDFVQFMGIAKIGVQGEPFDNRVIERLITLRTLYPDLPVSVDGAVGPENILELKKAGANRFAVGSSILESSDPKETYEQLLKIAS